MASVLARFLTPAIQWFRQRTQRSAVGRERVQQVHARQAHLAVANADVRRVTQVAGRGQRPPAHGVRHKAQIIPFPRAFEGLQRPPAEPAQAGAEGPVTSADIIRFTPAVRAEHSARRMVKLRRQ